MIDPNDDTLRFGFYGQPAGPARKWAPMPGVRDGAEHRLELRGPPNDKRWEPLCGGWAGDGYRRGGRRQDPPRCVACERVEAGKR
jgi:hypothetical protein